MADTSPFCREHVAEKLSFPALDAGFSKKETTLMGSRNATHENFTKVVQLMAEKQIAAERLLNQRFTFAGLAETCEEVVINNRQLIMGVIGFS